MAAKEALATTDATTPAPRLAVKDVADRRRLVDKLMEAVQPLHELRTTPEADLALVRALDDLARGADEAWQTLPVRAAVAVRFTTTLVPTLQQRLSSVEVNVRAASTSTDAVHAAQLVVCAHVLDLPHRRVSARAALVRELETLRLAPGQSAAALLDQMVDLATRSQHEHLTSVQLLVRALAGSTRTALVADDRKLRKAIKSLLARAKAGLDVLSEADVTFLQSWLEQVAATPSLGGWWQLVAVPELSPRTLALIFDCALAAGVGVNTGRSGPRAMSAESAAMDAGNVARGCRWPAGNDVAQIGEGADRAVHA